jgi:disulfide bond formation protein DsbB
MATADTTNAAARSVGSWAALLVALAGLAGSLYLSLAMKLVACPLCFYQRTFMMSAAAVLLMGLCTGQSRRLTLLALPLAVGGLGVALFHVSLELRGILECPEGIYGLGTAPQQSLAAFLVLVAILVADGWRGAALGQISCFGLFTAIAVGALLAIASTVANPPPPPAPTHPYPEAPRICRPPYHAAQ